MTVTAAEPQRTYALTKIGRGDYLLPSNDGRTLWRIYSYEEDGSAEWQDANGRWHTLKGTFWATAKFDYPPSACERLDDPTDWDHWTTWETTLSSRRNAIASALRSSPAEEPQ